jgi:xanthine/uracil permease
MTGTLALAFVVASIAVAKTIGTGHAGRAARASLLLGIVTGFCVAWWMLGWWYD